MAHSGNTTNFNLPQFSGTDHPSFTGDFNEAFLNLDNFLKDISTLAEQAQAAASAAQSKADEAWEKADQGGGFDLDKVYPVGSVFLSYSDELNPNTIFGGTWVKMQEGKYIRCTNLGGYPGGSGGSDTVTLNTANLPSHTHSVSGSTGSNGNHSHGGGSLDLYAELGFRNGDGFEICVSGDASGAFSYTENSGNTFAAELSTTRTPGCTVEWNSNGKWVGKTDATGNHSHSISMTSGSAGSGTAFSIEPTFLTVDFWTRTA